MDTLHSVIVWCHRGYYPVPAPHREKGPKLENWQELRITAETAGRYFNGAPQNVGVLQGEGGAADVDLDSREALIAFPEFAPETALIFGRASKPRSHWFYWCDPPCRSVRYTDPIDHQTLLEFRCLKTDGTVGLQTIVPPSVHPSGEPVEFTRGCDGQAANVDAKELAIAVRRTAAAALLGRHWPAAQGGRHDAFLALAGGMARAKWLLAEAIQFMRALYRVLWPANPDLTAAAREVESTYQRFDDGHETTGLPHLLKLADPAAAKQAIKWLGLWQEPKPQPRQDTAGFTFTSLRDLFNEPEEKIAWTLDGMLPAGGLSLIAGKPKAGKSTLARCLAVAVARGEVFLNRTAIKGPVLYLGLEEKRSEVRKHFEALGATGDEPIQVHIAPAPVQAILAAQRAIELYKPVLVIIDPLLKFARVKDANDYAQVTAALEPVLTLARESGAHLMLVYHAGKSAKADLIDSALGSTAFAGAVDTVLVYKRTEQYRILATIQRYGTDLPETVIEWDPERRSVALGDERSKAEIARAKTDILACLKPGVRFTEPQICDVVEGRAEIKRPALRELFKEGKISREGGGKKGDPFHYFREYAEAAAAAPTSLFA